MSKENQINLFADSEDNNEAWKKEWQDMPEFIQNNLLPYQQVIISFSSKEDLIKFSNLIGQKITYKTKSLWFPKINEQMSFGNKIYTNKKENES